MRYALVVVTKDQTAKTVTKVFYKHFLAVFGVPAKLLSDRGANFTSALVEELCATFGIQKCRSTASHAQCSGQVECFHQMLFHMIGKLACDKKAQWEQHLPELLQAYNSTQSVVTSFSLHYLMFGRCPHLLVDYFPTVNAFEHSHCMPTYMTEVRRCFKEAYAEVHLQTNCEAKKQNRYYDRTTSTAQLVPGNVVLMKNDAYQWSETEYVVVRCDCTPQLTVSCGHPSGGCHALGSGCATFRGKCCSIHPCRTYLVGSRERFARGIHGWG